MAHTRSLTFHNSVLPSESQVQVPTASVNFGRTIAAPLPVAQELPSEAGYKVFVGLNPDGSGKFVNETDPVVAPTAFAEHLRIYGELGRDADLIQKLLRRLPNQPADLHGNLQAMLSTAKRLQEKITKLIEAEV
jgi:hypothetical protein